MGTVQAGAARRVLVVSADAELRSRLLQALQAMRWQVREAAGGAEALALLEECSVAVVLMDHWLPDLEVGELTAMLRTRYPQVQVLGLDPDNPGLRRDQGCNDNVAGTNSFSSLEEFSHMLRQVQRSLPEAVARPGVLPSPSPPLLEGGRRAVAATVLVEPIEGLIGSAPAMQELAALIRRVAPTLATVLIEGETGTGKELVAQALHRLSPRAAKPLVVLNCAAIPEALLEAELFGHARGAFTGADRARTGRIEAAHGGTLFLDEIGEMVLALQAKMLRFLEAHELQRVGENEVLRVNVRVLAATHQDLEKKVAEGGFRLDLYHRLAVFPLQVPPLRERREDIPALAAHFLAQMARTAPRKQLAPDALDALLAHHWPGNVRELAHVLERATILAGDDPVLRATYIRLRRTGRI